MPQSKQTKLIILLCLTVIFATTVLSYAQTNCQLAKQQIDYYNTTPASSYCGTGKYALQTAVGGYYVYVICDTRSSHTKSRTDSFGSVYGTSTITVACYPTDGSPKYTEPSIRTFYKRRSTYQQCDNSTYSIEYDTLLFCSDSATCNSPQSCNYGSNPPPYVYTYATDATCLNFISKTSTGIFISIPPSCNLTDPPLAQQPHNLGPACGNSTPVNSSSNLKSGNYYHTQSVISKPASLPFELFYNSLETSDTPLGKGWSHTYNLSLVEGSTWISLKLGNGDSILFTADGSGSYQPDPKSGDTSVMSINNDGTYKRTFKDGTIQTFNTTAKLSSIKDLNGNTLSLYYSNNLLYYMYDSATGLTLNLTASNGRLATIRDSLNRTTTFTYTNNLLTSVTGPAGDTWQYVYDANGRMIQKTDPLGYQSTNSYDTNGKLISSTDPEGKTKSISYDSATNTSTITEKDGSIWHQQYDPDINAVTAKIDALGNTTSYSYDTKGNLLTQTAPNGATTSYTYDSNSNLLTETDPLGNTTRYTYNDLSLITSITDPKGNITSYTYDTKGNLTAITDPAGAVTSLINNTKGYVTQLTDPRGGITKLAYDSTNNLTTLTDPLGQKTAFRYDPEKNVSDAIKINQVGYSPEAGRKFAYAGAWRGDLGPLPMKQFAGKNFDLVDTATGKTVFSAPVKLRANDPVSKQGAPFTGEETLELDF